LTCLLKGVSCLSVILCVESSVVDGRVFERESVESVCPKLCFKLAAISLCTRVARAAAVCGAAIEGRSQPFRPAVAFVAEYLDLSSLWCPMINL
jgi:hypothetical protein